MLGPWRIFYVFFHNPPQVARKERARDAKTSPPALARTRYPL